MKKIILILFILCTQASVAQNANDILNAVTKAATKTTKGHSLSNDEIVKGLKEALTIGSKNGSDLASKVDGFYKNPEIKIPFPKEVKQVETTLNNLGMQKQTKSFVKSLNRAAEDAAKKAAPVFASAITHMSINDALGILNGSDDAATQFLKKTTSGELISQFKPVVHTSLQKLNVNSYWKSLAKVYNQVPLVEKVNPDLDKYVTERALEGLFKLVADEEKKIRKDPIAQVTDLLKKVFGEK